MLVFKKLVLNTVETFFVFFVSKTKIKYIFAELFKQHNV